MDVVHLEFVIHVPYPAYHARHRARRVRIPKFEREIFPHRVGNTSLDYVER